MFFFVHWKVVARSLPGLEQLAQVVCRFLDLSVVMPNIQSVHPTFVRAHREHGLVPFHGNLNWKHFAVYYWDH